MWLILLITAAFAEDLWTTAEVTALRWQGGPQTTVTLAPGSQVQVVLRDKDQVRVRYQQEFGWLPSSALTNVAPALPVAEGGSDALPKVTLTPGEAGQ